MIGHKNSEELKQMLENKEEFILVDCREQNEWDQGHIDGAILIPLSTLEEGFNQLSDKEKPIVLQCRSGKRSMNMAMFLQEKGFTNLFNLDGGIIDWQDSGYEVKK